MMLRRRASPGNFKWRYLPNTNIAQSQTRSTSAPFDPAFLNSPCTKTRPKPKPGSKGNRVGLWNPSQVQGSCFYWENVLSTRSGLAYTRSPWSREETARKADEEKEEEIEETLVVRISTPLVLPCRQILELHHLYAPILNIPPPFPASWPVSSSRPPNSSQHKIQTLNPRASA